LNTLATPLAVIPAGLVWLTITALGVRACCDGAGGSGSARTVCGAAGWSAWTRVGEA
jgi:hypothetical protein